MLRFVVIFTGAIIGFIIGEGTLSKFAFYYALVFSFLFTNFYYLDKILKSLAAVQEKKKNRDGKKYDLIPLNDAIANELMKIRCDLVKIRLNQDNFGEESLPAPLGKRKNYKTIGDWTQARENIEYFQMWLICSKYPSSFLCELYNTDDDKWGRIIIPLDDIYPDELLFNNRHELNDFGAENLRQLHSYRISTLKRDMKLPVYVCEPDEIGEPLEARTGKILSITNDDMRTYLKLEISLNSYEDDSFSGNKGQIIRTISIFRHGCCEFASDKEK